MINNYMANNYTFHYQGAIRDYIKQFLRIFSGFQVEYDIDRDEDSVKDKKTCQIFYGDMDRVVANVLHKDGTFIPTSLPLMTGVVTTIELNPEMRHSKYHQDNVSRVRGSDGETVSTQRKMGVPYKLSMDLSILTSNNTQMFQLLEQILMMFNPKLTIQKSENLIDWTYLTEVELVAVNPESSVPAGADERFISYSLSFLIDIWLDYPAKEDTGFIEQIFLNIKDNTNDVDGVDLDNLVITE